MTKEQELSSAVARLENVAEELRALQHVRPREYLGVEEAADLLGLSKIQLDMWRTQTPGGPAFCKVGRRVMYAVSDLRDFMHAHRQEPRA
ncbi:MAG: hypothetical protein AB7P97_20845 [Hyphomonadaceae bacterium]